MATVAPAQRPVRKLLILLDVVTTVAAIIGAPLERAVLEPWLRGWLPLRPLPPFGLWQTEYTLLIVLAVPVWVGLAESIGLHDMTTREWSLGALAKRVLQLHVLGFVVVASLIFATQVVVNRSLVALFLINSVLGMFVARACVLIWNGYRYRRGLGRQQLLLVGSPEGPLASFAEAADSAELAPQIVGFLGPDEDEAESGGPALERLGSLSDIARVLHDVPIDQVLFFRPYLRAEGLEDALLACEVLGVPAFLAVDVGLPSGTVPVMKMEHERPFVSLDSAPPRPELTAFKHLLDFFGALFVLLLVAPLLLLVVVAILVTMGRPIFFAQDRAGLRGRPFRMLKFRTMVDGAEAQKDELLGDNEMTGPVFKLRRDPRITRLGHLLRKTSIDELPQLFHVLTGTMSLVGPRPLPLDEQQRIRGWHRRRLAVRPGLTGLWQVSGRSNTTFERWMELDLEYVDGWSLWLDTKILLKTVPVVLLQRGAR